LLKTLANGGRDADTSFMLGSEEAEDTNPQAEAARRRRIRRRMALGTAATVGLGAAGLTILLRKGGGLSRSPNPLEYQHFVRGHDRKLSSGRVVPVRAHVRGPRGTAIKTTALIQPDQLHSITRNSEGIQLAIPEQFLAAA
jgi:hypothetical protein